MREAARARTRRELAETVGCPAAKPLASPADALPPPLPSAFATFTSPNRLARSVDGFLQDVPRQAEPLGRPAEESAAVVAAPREVFAPSPALILPPRGVIAPPREIIIAAASGGPLAAIDDGDGADDLGVESVEDDAAAPWCPRLTVADVFRVFGPAYRRKVGSTLTDQQDRVLRELMVCRTAVLGGHEWTCPQCGIMVDLFNSCGNRHCPACGSRERRKWAARVRGDVLPIEYHHLILTLPHELTELVLDHRRVLFPLMLRASAEAILQLVCEKYEAHPALLSMLHLCGQLMNPHVHSHTLVSAGGLSLDGERWITAPPGEFLPLDELARTFRDLFLKRLDSQHRRGKLVLKGTWWDLRCGLAWAHWLASFRTLKWIVHSRSSWEPRKDGLDGWRGSGGGVSGAVCEPDGDQQPPAAGDRRRRRVVPLQGQSGRRAVEDDVAAGRGVHRAVHAVPVAATDAAHPAVWDWGNCVRRERLTLARKLLGVAPPAPVDALPPSDPDEDPDEPKPRKCRDCGADMMCTGETLRPPVFELMAMPPSMGIVAYGGAWPLPVPLVAFT